MIEEEVARRVEELVAKRVEEELERRKDEIEAEVRRRVEEAKKIMEKQMVEELERQREAELEAQKKKEVLTLSICDLGGNGLVLLEFGRFDHLCVLQVAWICTIWRKNLSFYDSCYGAVHVLTLF